MKRPSGFTLIELLVVIAIIAVLSVIGLVSFTGASKKSRDGKREADLSQVRSALELYKAEKNTYPVYAGQTSGAYTSATNALQIAGYLTPPIPVDPKNASPYQYTYASAGNTYCVCAQLENVGSGNSTGGCNTTPGNYYCVVQP
ncbi:MAG: type II secretion system protein [Candidatus Woesebacteria bacterium]